MAIDPCPVADESAELVLCASYGRARTLPLEAYASDAVLRWEQRAFFDGSWVCIGRDEDVREHGGQKAVQVGERSYLLIRDGDGALRVFRNVCPHRGHELLAVGECVVRKSVRCPYHSWLYGLDGALRNTSRFGDVEGFDRGDYRLPEVRSHVWGGWVFVNVSGDAPSFEEHLGNLGAIMEPWRAERLVTMAKHDYVVESNWKTIVENYMECYHCPTIHPALCRVSDVDTAEGFDHTGVWTGGPLDLVDEAETMSLDGRSAGTMLPGLDDKQARQAFFFALFPNVLISPHPDYVMTHRLVPLGPFATHVECAWHFPPELGDQPDFSPAYAVDFWDVTNREDFAACESIARSMQAGGYEPGPFSSLEAEVWSVMGLIARGYHDGYLSPPPVAEVRLGR
jgi:Rieske 2Fe-2S family protein